LLYAVKGSALETLLVQYGRHVVQVVGLLKRSQRPPNLQLSNLEHEDRVPRVPIATNMNKVGKCKAYRHRTRKSFETNLDVSTASQVAL
jgi:hypothetical protein